MGPGALLIPAVPDAGPAGVAVLGAAHALIALGSVIFNVNSRSLRQAVAPEAMLGRVNASVRFLVWSTMPLGALTGGLLAESIGMRATLVLSGIGILAAPAWIVFSPVARMRDVS